MKPIAYLDFETFPIEHRATGRYPPKPVSMSYQREGIDASPVFMGWGHPTENNCTYEDAKVVVNDLVRNYFVVYYNAKFDLEVADVHFKASITEYFHDAMILVYLFDPRIEKMGLKDVSESLLGIPPEESYELRDWLFEHVAQARKVKKQWGKYIYKAPGKLVGKYADGDIYRTRQLFKHLYPLIGGAGMMKAYQRELLTLLLSIGMERTGIPIDRKRVNKTAIALERAQVDCTNRILKACKADNSSDVNLNSGPQVFDLLNSAGKIDGNIIKTPTGRVSTSRDALLKMCSDDNLVRDLSLRSLISKYRSTFFNALIEYSSSSGFAYASFNTTRRDNDYGTRTGRFSSSQPNFQNIPKDVSDKNPVLLQLQRVLVDYNINFRGVRDYVIAPDGYVILRRDYSQQELRILGHFEDDKLRAKYIDNPRLDVHQDTSDEVKAISNIEYARTKIKGVVFGVIYGRGVTALAEDIGEPVEEAKKLKQYVFRALPGLRELNEELISMGRANEPIRTWGGRLYVAETPKRVNGRLWEFYYKLLNVLIQGSAADCTKEGMLLVNQAINPQRSSLFIQVHDELLMLSDKRYWASEMALMKEAMESVKFDVPMLTEGNYSFKSWARMKECD